MTHRRRGDRFGNAPFMCWKTKIHYEYFEENKLDRLFGAMALLTCEWSRGFNLLKLFENVVRNKRQTLQRQGILDEGYDLSSLRKIRRAII